MSDSETRKCGAKIRSGGPCRRFPAPGKARCRLHGGAPGSGAPTGERNGNWKGGRYSKVATREQRQAAWREYWTAKRAQRGSITADIPDVLDLEIPTWPQE
jgi:hypothetical protein